MPQPTAHGPSDGWRSGRVVGADRVLLVLKVLGDFPQGATLDDVARAVGAPKPTVHRALAALKRAGLATQQDSGRYELGDELLRLAYSFDDARPETAHVRPILQALSAHFGEATHYAVLDGAEVVYRAKVMPASGGIQLTSVVGGRNPAHATAVGKLLLALTLPDAHAVRAWAAKVTLTPRTPSTITEVDELAAELDHIRERGWSSEDEECETGVCCVAVPYGRGPAGAPAGAVSVSAITYRTTLPHLVAEIDHVLVTVGAADLAAVAAADDHDSARAGR